MRIVATRWAISVPGVRKTACGAIVIGLLSWPSVGALASPQQTSESSPQSVTSSGDPKPDTVTIETQRQRNLIERQISTFVGEVATHFADESIARWEPPVCPLVAGLSRGEGEFVLARLSQIARNAGVLLGPEKCAPNFAIIATSNPQAMLEKWWSRNPRLFIEDRGIGGVKQFISKDRPIRVWYNANNACTLGAVEVEEGVAYPKCAVESHISAGVGWTHVRQIQSVIVVVDLGHIRSLSIGQITDYIAMVGLAQIRENPKLGTAPTILHLFDATGATRPQGLSSWDQAFLGALNSANQGTGMQVSLIKLRMKQNLIK